MAKLDWEKASRRDAVQASPKAQARYWWIPSRFNSRCSECRERIGKGERIAFDSLGRTAICQSCADLGGISAECKESKSMRAVKKRRRQQRGRRKKRG